MFDRDRFFAGIILLAAAAMPALGQAPQQMPPEAHASFEVATIKLSDPESQRQIIDTVGHRVIVRGQTVAMMATFAYGLHKEQLVGGPMWMEKDRYDVDGVADADGEPDMQQLQEMLRKLLVERFGLTFHHESREMAYYAITVAKGGPKLAKSAVTADRDPHMSRTGNGKQVEVKFRNTELPNFALAMQPIVDRPLADETGLKGRFDFALRWLPNEMQTPEDGGPPMLFTAVQEQLGLKLEAKKGPVDVMVVDKVGRPSAN